MSTEETLTFVGPDELTAWLAVHHEQATAVWLKIAKKSSNQTSVTSAEVIDVALCYGWIDGQRKTFDQDFFLQRISRRSPRGFWPKINVRKVEALGKADQYLILMRLMKTRDDESRAARLNKEIAALIRG